ncbi:Rab3 GTPase-activating protein regulatory subunit N-terminus-domain-containing protein [Cladochytrium replicatum]|nr:Rab3 GTPase-activating protein regulatory subunit N-terminus-domain-containing protein [Cladochytrium replicatum]
MQESRWGSVPDEAIHILDSKKANAAHRKWDSESSASGLWEKDASGTWEATDDWAWEAEDDKKPAQQFGKTVDSNADTGRNLLTLAPIADLCHDASHLLLANSSAFVLLRSSHTLTKAASIESVSSERSPTAHEGRQNVDLSILCSGSGVDDASGELITAGRCLSLYFPAKMRTAPGRVAVFIALGYNTGRLRIISSTGVTLLSQLFHPAPILTIKLRTVPSLFSQQNPAEDELVVLHNDRKAVSIDGPSLWTAIRLANDQHQYGETMLQSDQPTLQFKKWAFETQREVSDLVSLGPMVSASFNPSSLGNVLSTGGSGASAYSGTTYSSVYIGIGKSPMIALYGTSDSSRMFSILASAVATRVSSFSSAVFSYAKSWLGSEDPSPTQGEPRNQSFAPTIMPSILTVSDHSHRHITSIKLSPPSEVGSRRLAALVDTLGRVMVMDVEEGEVIRMWKGFRDAQVAWLESFDEDHAESAEASPGGQSPIGRRRRRRLYLAIYAARGALEVHSMRHGSRLAALQVGQNVRLLQNSPGLLGGAYGSGFRSQGSKHWEEQIEPPAEIFLLLNSGVLKRFTVASSGMVQGRNDGERMSLQLNIIRKMIGELAKTEDKDIRDSLISDLIQLVRTTEESDKAQVLTFIREESLSHAIKQNLVENVEGN